MLPNSNLEHLMFLTINNLSEYSIGNIHLFDGDTYNTYLLSIWQGDSNKTDELYVSLKNPKNDLEDREVYYLDEIIHSKVFNRVQEAVKNGVTESFDLHKKDLKIDQLELIRDERYGNWLEKIEKKEQDFSKKELSIYREMKKLDYPQIPFMEEMVQKELNNNIKRSIKKIEMER